MVFEYLQETFVDREIPLLAVRYGHIREDADAEQPQQRGVARQNPHVPILTGNLHLPDQIAHQLALGRGDFEF